MFREPIVRLKDPITGRHRIIDTRHGGAYDRGRADVYYGRERDPHMFTGKTYQSKRIEEADMTDDQVVDYNLGYDTCEDRKF